MFQESLKFIDEILALLKREHSLFFLMIQNTKYNDKRCTIIPNNPFEINLIVPDQRKVSDKFPRKALHWRILKQWQTNYIIQFFMFPFY